MQEGTAVETVPTLFLTREISEHANVFHTMTDLLNVFITLEMLAWHDKDRQVVLLDDHPQGPLDPLWPAIAAGHGYSALQAGTQSTLPEEDISERSLQENWSREIWHFPKCRNFEPGSQNTVWLFAAA